MRAAACHAARARTACAQVQLGQHALQQRAARARDNTAAGRWGSTAPAAEPAISAEELAELEGTLAGLADGHRSLVNNFLGELPAAANEVRRGLLQAAGLLQAVQLRCCGSHFPCCWRQCSPAARECVLTVRAVCCAAPVPLRRAGRSTPRCASCWRAWTLATFTGAALHEAASSGGWLAALRLPVHRYTST